VGDGVSELRKLLVELLCFGQLFDQLELSQLLLFCSLLARGNVAGRNSNLLEILTAVIDKQAFKSGVKVAAVVFSPAVIQPAAYFRFLKDVCAEDRKHSGPCAR